MKTAFTIIGSIFTLISGSLYKFDHNHLGLSFAVLALISFMVALFVYFNKSKKAKKDEINLKEFTFIDPPGYYTHPKYPNQKICPSCLIKTKSISPVSQLDKNAWYCNVCDKPLSGSKGEVFSLED